MATRKQRAHDLLKTANRGPAYGCDAFGGSAKLQKEARQAYRLWATTWLLPEIIRLVPELKGVKPPEVSRDEAAL